MIPRQRMCVPPGTETFDRPVTLDVIIGNVDGVPTFPTVEMIWEQDLSRGISQR